MNKWIAAAIILAVVGIGAALVGWTADDNWGPDRGGDIVTRSVGEDGTEMIVVREGDRRFSPFGLFIVPLVIFFAIFVLRGFAFHGRSAGFGPWMHGGPGADNPPVWLDEWHRRAHTDASAPSSPVDRDQPPVTR